jgi:hypothetical protein
MIEPILMGKGISQREKFLRNIAKKVYRAVKSGRIQKKPCSICGDLKSQVHHEDYSKIWDITWLCQFHHIRRHLELKGRSLICCICGLAIPCGNHSQSDRWVFQHPEGRRKISRAYYRKHVVRCRKSRLLYKEKNRDQINELSRNKNRRDRENLGDYYIRKQLRRMFPLIKRFPEEMINWKREQILIHRKLKALREEAPYEKEYYPRLRTNGQSF